MKPYNSHKELIQSGNIQGADYDCIASLQRIKETTCWITGTDEVTAPSRLTMNRQFIWQFVMKKTRVWNFNLSLLNKINVLTLFLNVLMGRCLMLSSR